MALNSWLGIDVPEEPHVRPQNAVSGGISADDLDRVVAGVRAYQARVDAYYAEVNKFAAKHPLFALTPEGQIKEKIKRVFRSRAPDLYYHMPVQNGMGAPTLDFIGCYGGHYFAVEAKAPNKDLTERQRETAKQIEAAGGVVFRIRDDADLAHFELWLDSAEE